MADGGGGDVPAESESVRKTPAAEILQRDHGALTCALFICSLSLCIATDILQYSMPLAFLPSVLEDRGHSPFKIATAIGVYYWTGFLGGMVITTYKVWRVVQSPDHGQGPTTVATSRFGVGCLIAGLGIGTLTLALQAMWPSCHMHIACRFVQGLLGAFIFFYAFLLSVQVFRGRQQVVAMTSATCALNVAEVMGAVLGAAFFEAYGNRGVFAFLAGISVLNQGLLVVMFCLLRPVPPEEHDTAMLSARARGAAAVEGVGFHGLLGFLRNPLLLVSVALIFTSAMVKGSVEEALPFHADHEWGFPPLRIGKMFAVIAVAYISAAVVVGQFWMSLGRLRLICSGIWLSALGVACWGLFGLSSLGSGEYTLNVLLGIYGVCLGMTHTPAALLVAEAIEEESHGPSKDAVNAIWNTMWEAGGSLGFLAGGALAATYRSQLRLMAGNCFLCLVVGICIVASRGMQQSPKDGPKTPRYGAAV